MHQNIFPPPPRFAHDDVHDCPHFTPAPCRCHTGWTAIRQHLFIDALCLIGHVGEAAKVAGMSRKSAYALRDREDAESFAAAWDCALTMGQDRVRDVAIDRAINGYKVPYFYGGRQRGEYHRYDNRLIEKTLDSFRRIHDTETYPGPKSDREW